MESSGESSGLFGETVAEVQSGPKPRCGASPRLRRPEREQVVLQARCLDELLPERHQARTLWAVVQKLDLDAFYEPLKARGENPGRAATDPRLLVALWLWAATQGQSSARRVADLCEQHDAYKWLCGGVSVNHHTLSDFRVDHEAALDELFTLVLAMLMERKLVTVRRMTQDGLRVRASAGQSSFKKQETLEKHYAAAQEQVRLLKLQAQDPANDNRSARQRAAQERAAREREQRVSAAMARLPELAAIKAKHNGKKSKHPPRASITDAAVPVMKMPDGGFGPAYNVELAQDPESRAIVGVDVCTDGTDYAQSEPMRQQVEERSGQKVEEHAFDGGFVKLEVIERAEESGVTIYAPPKQTTARPDPYTRCEKDGDHTAAWRQRMGTAEAKMIYKQRASTAETVNADLRMYRGLGPFLVRGLKKVRCVVLWSALAYNLMHFGLALLA
jgi:transposase